MAGLPRRQDELGALVRAQVGNEAHRRSDGLRVRVGVAIKAQVDRHAVAWRREWADR